MGFWSFVKAVARVIVKVVVAVVMNVTFGLFDLFFGFAAWPPKKMRLQVFILSEPDTTSEFPFSRPVASVADVQLAIDKTIAIYKKRFNIQIVSYSKQMIQHIPEEAPASVLDFQCGLGSEFDDQGAWFADHTAGWNAVPISMTFPISVFVVRSLTTAGPLGCSMATLGDYVVIATPGLLDPTALAHEIGHTCNLWHSRDPKNLMIGRAPGGDEVKWFQKNLVRSSRHATYW